MPKIKSSIYRKLLLVGFLIFIIKGYLFSQSIVKSTLDPISYSKCHYPLLFNAGMPFHMEDIQGDTLFIPGIYGNNFNKEETGIGIVELYKEVNLWIDSASKILYIQNPFPNNLSILMLDINGSIVLKYQVTPGYNSIKIDNMRNQLFMVGCEYNSKIVKIAKFKII